MLTVHSALRTPLLWLNVRHRGQRSTQCAGLLQLALFSSLGGTTSSCTQLPSGSERDGSKPSPVVDAAVLCDQFGHNWNLRDVLAGPAVLLLSGPVSAETNTRWDIDVLARMVDEQRWVIHRAVDLSSVPRLFSGIASARIRKRTVPAGTPVLLDWGGLLATRFGTDSTTATIVVLTSSGVELGRIVGPPNDIRTRRLESLLGTRLNVVGEDGTSHTPDNGNVPETRRQQKLQ